MKTNARLLSVLTAGALCGVAAPSATAVPDPGGRVIGGETATTDVGAVSVGQGDFTQSHCSGSLLSETKVLTAKHCTDLSHLTVRVGSLRNDSGGTVLTVRSVQTQNDVAVLTLDSPATGAKTVTLATSDPSVGTENRIYGWGRTSYDGPGSPVLKTARVQVTSTSATDAYGGSAIRSTKVDGNAWKGDSGGPQFSGDRQVGVASTADGVSIQNYASVPANLSFIRSAAGL